MTGWGYARRKIMRMDSELASLVQKAVWCYAVSQMEVPRLHCCNLQGGGGGRGGGVVGTGFVLLGGFWRCWGL